jgi:mannose-1-phosphate guanylyltransferase/mannose-6-phosphate isomerase
MISPVILAGGKGVRLWPVSREMLPKPYVPALGSGETLLQATLRRAAAVPGASAPLVVCNAGHDFLVRAQASDPGALAMILEPEGRNTAPALCAAALWLSRSGAGDRPMLVLPADHAIRDEAQFAAAMASGADLARQGHLVTFAIAPSFPATGYGYLKIGAAIDPARGHHRLASFVEKPDAATAAGFLAQGGYAWNSGMFVFLPDVLLRAFADLRPDILEAVTAAVGGAGPGAVLRLDPAAFARAPSISIDYAIMERAPNVATVLAGFDWSDVGDWQAVWSMADRDDRGNAVSGNAFAVDSAGSLIRSDGPLVMGVGLSDMIAVASKDAVVVAPRDRAQDVRLAVDLLARLTREEAVSAKTVLRPWGSYEQLHIGAGFQVKELTVHPGAKLSLQRHKHRAEHWVCIAGTGVATRDGERIPLAVDTCIYLPLGCIHRLENTGKDTLRVIEVQIGSYTGEDDIERFEDVYGRA